MTRREESPIVVSVMMSVSLFVVLNLQHVLLVWS
jgi:hypothetical protein